MQPQSDEAKKAMAIAGTISMRTEAERPIESSVEGLSAGQWGIESSNKFICHVAQTLRCLVYEANTITC